MGEKLTNINAMLVKMGLAYCTDEKIYHGEGSGMTTTTSMTSLEVCDQPQPAVSVNMPKNAISRQFQQSQKRPERTKLERDVRRVLGQPNKTLNHRPENSVMCRVTTAISPSEIWLQDIVDANEWYRWFQDQLAKR